MSEQRLRVALIGVTGYGAIHLRNLLSDEINRRFKLCAAVIVNPEAARGAIKSLTANETTIYSSVDEMWQNMSGRIDLTIIPTGIAWHETMTCQALRERSNVLVEKPAAATIEEVDTMLLAEAKANLKVFVGFQDIYQPSVQWAKRVLLSGEIGRPIRMRAQCLWPRPCSYYQRNAWAGRLNTPEGWVLDSPINNAMAHFINLCLFFAGRTQNESSPIVDLDANLYRIQEIESFDTVSLLGRTRSLVDIYFWGSHSSAKEQPPEIIVECERGELHWSQTKGAVLKPNGKPSQTVPMAPDSLTSDMLNAIYESLQSTLVNLCPLKMARMHTDLVQRLHKTTEIVTVSSEHVRTQYRDGDIYRFIPSLHNDTKECSNQLKHYDDMMLQWAN